jgi:hypothetical protein
MAEDDPLCSLDNRVQTNGEGPFYSLKIKGSLELGLHLEFLLDSHEYIYSFS